MKKLLFTLTAAVPAMLAVAVAVAQPPGDEGRPPGPPPQGGPEGPGGGRGRPPRPNPVVEALDTDHNGEISAEEIINAAAALKKLDANGNGTLTEDELRPPGAPGRPPGPPDGPEGRPPGPPGPPDGPEGRPPRPGAPPEGRPPGPPNGEGRPPGGPGGPDGPGPERFADDALAFDGDGDGKLDRAELIRFAQSRPRPGQPGGPGARDGPVGVPSRASHGR